MGQREAMSLPHALLDSGSVQPGLPTAARLRDQRLPAGHADLVNLLVERVTARDRGDIV